MKPIRFGGSIHTVTTVGKVVTVLDIGYDGISDVLCNLSLGFLLICIVEILKCKMQWN
jgi:hypothetical protein